MTGRKKTAQDFVFKGELGHGSYSRVYKAIENESGQIYAIKVCSKKHIIRERKVKYVMIEKNTLNLLASGRHTGMVTLHYTFHDTENLYYVLDYAPGGELLQLLQERGRFSERWARHFMCQLIDVVGYVHECKVIHRDLKPENVLLSGEGRVMLTDFGAACNLNDVEDGIEGTASFVGTAEYVSPELLLENRCNYSSDIWALGCMLYQFTQGFPPFKGSNELETFERIVRLNYRWEYQVTRDVTDLCSQILVIDPMERYNLAMIRSHKWFQGVDWNNKEQLWRGIWQIQGNTKGTNSIVVNSTMGNIPIRSRKRKPAKATQTTSSIVQWRKTLNMDYALSSPVLPPPPPSSSTSALCSSPKISAIEASNKNKLQNSISVPSRTRHHPRPIFNHSESNRNGFTHGLPLANSKPHLEPIRVTTAPHHRTTKTTPINPIPKSPIESPLSIPAMKGTHSIPVSPNNHELNSHSQNTSANIVKQNWVTILEIPFVQRKQKTFTMNEYSFVDDETIAQFLVKNSRQVMLKSNLRLMSLDSKGNLYHRAPNAHKYTPIVSILDSDLSIYDFDFDETRLKGFLILEKFKTNIWFISVAKNASTDYIINGKESWIKCVFNTREKLESEKLSNKMEKLQLANHRNGSSDTSLESSSDSKKNKKSKTHNNMLVSSSRYEVISTLSRQKRGSADAACGATAAFKNMAK